MGLPWSISSTATLSLPNSPTSRSSSRAAAAGPAVASAAGTSPLRQPVSTSQRPSAAAPSASSSYTGLPFSPPAYCAWLIARDSDA